MLLTNEMLGKPIPTRMRDILVKNTNLYEREQAIKMAASQLPAHQKVLGEKTFINVLHKGTNLTENNMVLMKCLAMIVVSKIKHNIAAKDYLLQELIEAEEEEVLKLVDLTLPELQVAS